MFSTRFGRTLEPNAFGRELEAARATRRPLLDLTLSNPTRAEIEYPEEEILRTLCDRRALVYEPAPAGLPSAREAVADWYGLRGGKVDPARVLLTASTSEAYSYLFKLLADPGDDVLVPVPSYPLFEHLATAESIAVRPYPLGYHGRWTMELDELEAAVGPRTRAILVVSPNNPTGSFLKTFELERLLALASSRGLAIVSDEVFADYPHGSDAKRVETLAGRDEAVVFALSGLSKAAGLPQMKVGWIAASGPARLLETAWARLELIADTFLSVSSPAQWALPAWLELGAEIRDRIAARLAENRAALEWILAPRPECEVLRSEGGWSAVLRVPRLRSEEELALEMLRTEGVIVHPGYFFDFPTEAHLVVSLLPSPTTFCEGLGRVVRRLAALGAQE